MPWSKHDYPPSMKNLEPRVRNKAVEIANALLEEDYDEGRAIAIATAKAQEWDENHPKDESENPGISIRKLTLHAGELLLVGPSYERPLTVSLRCLRSNRSAWGTDRLPNRFLFRFSVPYVTVMVITCPAIDTANIVYKISTNGM